MVKEEKRKGGMPLVIIVGVLIAAVVGLGVLYSCSAKPGTPNNNAKTPRAQGTPPNAPEGANPPNMLGSPTATVTVEEYADFQCPSCGDKFPVMKQIQSVYGSRIRFIFRHFPLTTVHDKAYDAAVAAEAAGLQGKFWDMQNQLYTNQKSWSVDPNYKQVWADYAQKIGLDMEKWKTDMAGLPAKSRVDADIARGRFLQIGSTPTVYINGKAVTYAEMTVDTLRALIDAELNASQPGKQGGGAANAAPGNDTK